MTWCDSKPLSVLATLPTSTEDSSIVQQSVKANGKWENKQFSRPGLIDLYKTFTSPVDVSDQRTVAYEGLMKGAVWYFSVFFFTL